jgi:Histidine kinase/Histidine kinase-, DNA gyrase B-, and HSP90-like ATPase
VVAASGAQPATFGWYSRPVSRRITVALAVCTIIGLLHSAEYAFWLRATGKPVSLAQVLLRECPSWIVWALCVPAVITWGERFRLEWPPRPPILLAHGGGVAAATLVFAIMRVVIMRSLDNGPPAQSLLIHLRDSLVYSLPMAVITYGATIGLGYAASYSARSRQLLELRTELSKAQLTALRMQLNPHFFFNTLHTIGALVRDGNHVGAVEMIEKLGDVLHHVLRTDGDPETPLRDEVEFLRKYLEIEQVRFGDRLRVAWHLDEASESVPVPQLILQPLVENALRHGLSRRARPGSLTIRALVQDEKLELVVADDGVGLPSDFGARASGGVGLANVRARLSRMYGEAARLSLGPGENGGVTARIVLPVGVSGEPIEALRD